MRLSFVIALLLAPASATRLTKIGCSTTATLAQVGGPSGPTAPVAEAVAKVALKGLNELVPQIQRERATIQYAIDSLNGMDRQASGAKLAPGQQYDPKFVADLVVAEFADIVDQMNQAPELLAGVLQDVARATPLGQLMAQKPGQPESGDLPRTPRDWCMKQPQLSSDKAKEYYRSTCQLTEAMPNPSMVLNEWARAIGGLTAALEGPYGKDIAASLAGDIGVFNQILAAEANRLGVALPAAGFPDPQEAADRILKYAKLLGAGTKENYEQILRQIEMIEMGIAGQGANVYRFVSTNANNANQGSNQAKLSPNELPTNEQDAVALASGVLKILNVANQQGGLDAVFWQLQSLARMAGVPVAEIPPVDMMKSTVQAYTGMGIDSLKQPANQDQLYKEEKELQKEYLKAGEDLQKKVDNTIDTTYPKK